MVDRQSCADIPVLYDSYYITNRHNDIHPTTVNRKCISILTMEESKIISFLFKGICIIFIFFDDHDSSG